MMSRNPNIPDQQSYGRGKLLHASLPAGSPPLRLRSVNGSEGLSQLFRFDLEFAAVEDHLDGDVLAGLLLGKQIGFGITLSTGAIRMFDGVVSRFIVGTDRRTLQIEFVPWLWLLSRCAECRTFAGMNVREITDAVFAHAGFAEYEFKLSQSYPQYELCVQYRETTLNFLLRLWEKEGISFHFRTSNGKHHLVLTDDLLVADPRSPLSVLYRPGPGAEEHEKEDAVHTWVERHEMRPAMYTLNARDWTEPGSNLLVSEETAPKGVAAYGELYDLGEYTKNDQGKRYIRLRMEEEEVGRRTHNGSGNVRTLEPGRRIQLARGVETATLPTAPKFSFASDYVVTALEHHAYEMDDRQDESYSNTFMALPAGVAFRPARHTPKPVIHGIQYATIAGPDGKDATTDGPEVNVDTAGRVRLCFFWDRTPASKAKVLARVSQAWAGHGFGAWFIPRIGQEVVVAFEEGDPDHPVVVGAVYHEARSLPFDSKESQTITGFRTHSTRDDARSHGNELSFEDATGREELRMFAQLDMNVRVQRDERTIVGNDLFHYVSGNQMDRVGKDRRTLVDGNVTEKTAGNWGLAVGGNAVIDAAGGILIDGGGCRLRLGPAGFAVELDGNYIVVSAEGVRVNGQLVKLNCAGAAPGITAANLPSPTIPDPPPRKGNK